MANKDMVVGAEPYGQVLRANVYKAQSTIYRGDFVKKNAAGTVEPAAAGDLILGVALHYAAAAAEIRVLDHPDQLFTIQAAASEVDAQTDIGLNADIIVGTPDATYKRSAMELDGSTLATSAAQLQIIGVDRSVDNALGANCKCIVRINEHQFSAAAAAALGV